MQIKIEIDVKPEELRRFLGLPDVAGLQEDVLNFVREKLGQASEGFDPASFVRENLQTLKRSSAWQKLLAAARPRASAEEAAPQVSAKRAARKRRPPATRPSAPRQTKPAVAGETVAAKVTAPDTDPAA